MVKEIICKTDGAVILVDDEDYPVLSRFPWYRGGMGAHPMTFIYGKNDTSHTVYMHQILSGGAVNTDHIDLNVCNMQKDNLRPSTYQTNGWNKGKQGLCSGKRVPTSRFKGVSYRPLRGTPRWLAMIKHVEEGKHKSTGKMIYIGYFFDEIEAAKAYNAEVKELRGEWAWVNPIPGEAGESLENNGLQVCRTKSSGEAK